VIKHHIISTFIF